MDEVEVEVVGAEVGEGLPAGALHVLRVVLVVPQLGGDEELPPGHPRGGDARSNLRLVAVDGGAVEMAISLPEGVLHSRLHLARAALPGGQAWRAGVSG